MTKLKDIVNLAAPHTWTGSVTPAMIGLAIAYHQTGTLDILMVCCLLIIVILMQSAVNAFDDYADFVKGTDTLDNSPDAYDAVIVYGMKPVTARNLGFLFLLLAAIPAVYVVFTCGLVPLYIGLTGAVVLLCYAFGRYPISYLPLGELLCGFVMGGLIPLAAYYMQVKELDWSVLFKALPPMIGMSINMFSNNGCDIERDIPAGRKTLACLIGRSRTGRLYRILLILWVLSPVAVLGFQMRWGSLLVYSLASLAFLHLVWRQYRLELGAPAREAVMTGATTLVSLVGLAYALAIVIG